MFPVATRGGARVGERLSINWLMLKDQSKTIIDDVSAGN